MIEIKPTGQAEDTYLSVSNSIQRLIDDYHQFGYIIVAVDFDSTLCPKNPGESCNQVVELLQAISSLSGYFKIIVFTCRESLSDLDEVSNKMHELNIHYDKINDNINELTIATSRKIFYNIFLDDRAGLKSAYETLVGFLNWLQTKER